MEKDLFKPKKQKNWFGNDKKSKSKKMDFKKELGRTALVGGSIILLAEGADALG